MKSTTSLKRALSWVLASSLLLICIIAHSQVGTPGGLGEPAIQEIKEEDGSPDAFPSTIKVTNGTLTDNGDGTVSLNTGGSAGATSLTGLSDVGSADPTIGHILVADGSKFQSVNVPMSVRTDTNNVGIGVTAPTDTLHLSTLDAGGLLVNSSTGGMGGIDANTSIILHLNGTNGSTTFTDSSFAPHTFSAGGSAQISTAQFEFGGASLLENGGSDVITSPDSDDWFLGAGTGDWTIDLWFYTTDNSVNEDFLEQFVDGFHFWRVYWAASGGFTYGYRDGGAQELYQFGGTISNNTWYHAEFVRSGNNVLFFLNGVGTGGSLPLTTTSQTNFNAQLGIGTVSFVYKGYMDEVRISSVARNTSNFTPPTSQYTNSVGGQATVRFASNNTVGWTMGEDGATNGSFKLGTTGFSSTKVTVNSSGNVGIGTTTPLNTLHVVGNTRITGLSSCTGVQTNSSGDLSCGSAGATSLTGLSDVGSATQTAGNILVSDGTKFQSIAVSGDTTMTSAGVVTIGSNKVSSAKMVNTGVAAGTYGDGTFTVDSAGRITTAASGSLTGLTDVGSATATAGRLLVADGTKFQSVGMSGSCTLASSGAISCASSATSLTGLSDVGSATTTAGNVLIADGTKFQSVAISGDVTTTSAGVTTIGATKVSSAKMVPSGVTAGTYGDGTFTVDTSGRITSAATGSLTGLSDVGSATNTAANLLVADGTKFQSVAVSGDITMTSAGVTTIGSNKVTSAKMTNTGVTAGTYGSSAITVDSAGRILNASAGSLTGNSDVGSATTTAGRVLIADGTKFQSVAISGDITVTSAGVTAIGTDKVGPIQLQSTAVTAGTYSSTALTVDADGRITNASSGSLTGLTDVSSATKTAGNILVADGTNFKSVSVSGNCSMTSAGAVTCSSGGGWTDPANVIQEIVSTDDVMMGATSLTNNPEMAVMPVANKVYVKGNLGIGYTAPAAVLSVNGNVGIGTSAAARDLDIVSAATSTTGLSDVANSLTTGGAATFSSSSSSTGTRNLVEITNSNSAAKNVTLLNVSNTGQDDTGAYAVKINPGRIAIGPSNLGLPISVFNSDNFNANDDCTSGCYGIVSFPMLKNPTNPTIYVGLLSQPRTGGSGVTVATMEGLQIATPTIGAGDSVTNLYGIFLANQTGGSNNYSIFSNGGRNFFSGNTGIGYSAPTGALVVNGNVGIGISAPVHDLDIVSAATSVTGISDVGNSLTTGGLAQFSSSSSNTGTRNLIEITNSNSGSFGAVGLRVNQNSSAPAIIAPSISGDSNVGGDLTLTSTTSSTKGMINLDDNVTLWPNIPDDVVNDLITFNATIDAPSTGVQLNGFNMSPTFTSSGATAINQIITLKNAGTYRFDTNPTFSNSFYLMLAQPTVTLNGAGVIASNLTSLYDQLTLTTGSTVAAGTTAGVVSHLWNPIISSTGAAATNTVTNFVGLKASPRMSSATGGGSPSVTTITSAKGLWMQDLAKSGSGTNTLTNLIGVDIDDLTTGTNDYGIRSAITSGTNKFFLNDTGGAKSRFTGNVGIGFSAPGAALVVSGNIGIGKSTASQALDVVGEAAISGISGDGSGKVVCIKADGNLGTCSSAVAAGGTCTCG